MKHKLATLLFFGAAMIPAAAMAAQLVVVEARGIGYAQGTTIDSTKSLTLKEGQHLTLISAAGVTIKLDGPFTGTPDTAGSKGVGISEKLSALTAGGRRYGEVGTTRAAGPVKLPSPWVMDAGHSGPACLVDGQTPVLWREASTGKTQISITPDDQSWRATIEWPAGSNELPLSKAVPLHPGTTYYIDMNGERQAISVVSVPSTLASDHMRAAWLADKGCEAQAQALVLTLK